MNADVKQWWIDALNSDEYKQGRGQLRTDDGGYCCLAVLCDVHRKHTGQGGWDKDDRDRWVYRADGAQSAMALPPAVLKWAELEVEDGDVRVLFPQEEGTRLLTTALSGLNDNRRLSFREIAVVIDMEL